MKTHVRRWIADGPVALQRGLVPRARIALVRVEVVAGVVLGLGSRMIRSRVTLARIDAAATDRQVASAFTRCVRRGARAATKSQLPSTTAASGATPRPSIARAGREALRGGHAELVALLLADAGPTAHAAHHPAMRSNSSLPLGLGEHLRVAAPVDPAVARAGRPRRPSAGRPTRRARPRRCRRRRRDRRRAAVLLGRRADGGAGPWCAVMRSDDRRRRPARPRRRR